MVRKRLSQEYKSRPGGGNARKIWDGLTRGGCAVKGLWYNPNCWGAPKERGWGTWAFFGRWEGGGTEMFCGIVDGRVYVQQTEAPFASTYVEKMVS